MADPTSLTISIDRTSMSLSPLVLTGHDDPTRFLSVSGWREPAMQARITYAPTGDSHGDVPLAWSYQETVLAFNVFDELATTETTARAHLATLAAAIGRLNFTVTVTVAGGAPEAWTCRPGSITPADDRSLVDLKSHQPVWSVAIPAHPIRSL